MNAIKIGMVLAVASLGASGCMSELRYSGSGHLHDAGPFAAVDRYVIDLGEIDLRNSSSASFQLANLPQEALTIGLDISFVEVQRTIELAVRRPIFAVVNFELRSADGSILLRDEVSLYQDAAWWASGADTRRAFIYSLRRRTTFVPEPERAYSLSVTVVQPDRGSTDYTAAVAVRGGGWQGRD